MHLEIERRFLARPEALARCGGGCRIVQGYLQADGTITVRVRIVGDQGFLTIKGKRAGSVRLEHETEIPVDQAQHLLASVPAGQRIEKVRYLIEEAGQAWELDVFEGLNAGLMIAEVELDDPGQPLVLPVWLGAEVTENPRYSNSALARRPLADWALAA